MILPIHIIIALSSLVCSAIVFFYPTKTRLNLTYALVALTFISGFYLTMTRPVHLTQICGEGLVYLGAMLAGIIVGRRKLLKQTEHREVTPI